MGLTHKHPSQAQSAVTCQSKSDVIFATVPTPLNLPRLKLLFGSRRKNWSTGTLLLTAEESDDDVDLFGSDDEEEDAEAERIKAERVAAYNKKKEEKESKKGKVIAKSNIIMDIKPWDDETDMKELEAAIRSITMDGLLWGTGKLVEIGYGIKKLQITCVIEDDKVMMDDLEDQIIGFEDYVQSMDIVAFNKI